jgi:hypothetical protein
MHKHHLFVAKSSLGGLRILKHTSAIFLLLFLFVQTNGKWAVVPLCPQGVKQRQLVQALAEHGLMGTRMGTDETRTLLVCRGNDPPQLLIRHLSPTTRNLATHVGVRTILCPDAEQLKNGHRSVTLPGVDGAFWLDLISRLLHDLGREKRFIDLHRMTVANISPILVASDAFEAWKRLPPLKGVKPSGAKKQIRSAASTSQPTTGGVLFPSIWPKPTFRCSTMPALWLSQRGRPSCLVPMW